MASKMLAADGAGWMIDRNAPDTYGLGRGAFRDFTLQSGTPWVKFWINWHQLQNDYWMGQGGPPNVTASWNQLVNPGTYNAGTNPDVWALLDHQIATANGDGKSVLLGLYHRYPLWSWTAQNPPEPRGSQPIDAHIPDNRGIDGPFGWFLAYLLARYHPWVPANPNGGVPGQYGNPRGAKVHALEPCNEPNLVCWPQLKASGEPRMGCDVAGMLSTAYTISNVYGSSVIFGPSTADLPDPVTDSGGNITGSRYLVSGTDWYSFNNDVMFWLANSLNPSLYLGWSHHNYRDVLGRYLKTPEEYTLNPPRALSVRGRRVVTELRNRGYPWPGIWVTEGGYKCWTPTLGAPVPPAELSLQRTLVSTGLAEYNTIPEAWTYCHYTLNDGAYAGDTDQYGLREPFQGDTTTGSPGTERPAGLWWRTGQ